MAKNFEENTLIAKNDAFVKDSNEHGEKARTIFAENLAYVIRTGNVVLLNNMRKKMHNSGDLLLFAQGIDVIRKEWFTLLNDDDADVIRMSFEGERKVINLFLLDKETNDLKFNTPQGEDAKKVTVERLFKRKLLETYNDDETLADALKSVFRKANDQNKAKANQSFDLADYLGKVIGTVINKVAEDNPELAKSVASDLNKVIRGHFKGKEMESSAINAKVAEKSKKDTDELEKALAIARKHGAEIKMPELKVIEHEAPKIAAEKPATETVEAKRARA